MPVPRVVPALLLSLLALLIVAAGARADWTAPVAVTPTMSNGALLGLAAPNDVPAVLTTRRRGPGDNVLELRRARRARGPLGAPVTIATSDHGFGGAAGGSSALGGGSAGDGSAAWLQIINGARRAVVATGARPADRQVLSTGPRSTQILAYASDRLGDAVVAFWRYAGNSSTSYQVLASYRQAHLPFDPPQVVATGTPGFPVVTIGEDRRAAVGWSTPNGFQVAEHAAGSGGAFTPAATIPGSAGPGVGNALALAEGDDGRAEAAWSQRGTMGGVMVAERSAGQTAWGAPTVVSDSGAPVRTAAPPGLTAADQHTYVAWTEAPKGPPAPRDVTRLAVARDGVWGAAPATIDSGIRGLWTQTQLLPLTLGRMPQVVISANRAHRIVTTTVRYEGTLGPRRTLTTPGSGTVAWAPIGAQGANATWLAWGRSTPGGATDVLLARSFVR